MAPLKFPGSNSIIFCSSTVYNSGSLDQLAIRGQQVRILVALLYAEAQLNLPSESGLLISIIAIDSDTIGDTFRVLLSVLAILFSMVPLSIIAVLLQSIVNNHASDKFENDKLIKHIVLTRC